MRVWAAAIILGLAAGPVAAQSAGEMPRRSDYTLEVMDNLRHELAWRERRPIQGEGHKLYFAELSIVSVDTERVVSITGPGATGPITVIGFCDLDCLAMGIQIIDQDSQVVATASPAGRFPEVTFHRDGVRQYYARITAPGCQAAYCFYSLGALQAD